MSEERVSMSVTNLLTALAGLYTMAMAYLAPLAVVFVAWTSVGLMLGAVASTIGILKALHE